MYLFIYLFLKKDCMYASYFREAIPNISVPRVGVEYELGHAPGIDVKALLDDTARDLQCVAATASRSEPPELMMLEDDGQPMLLGLDAGSAVVPVPENISPEVPEDDDVDRLSRMYPNSLPTTDLKHIVDNLLGECLGVMSLLLGYVSKLILSLRPFVGSMWTFCCLIRYLIISFI